MTAFIRHKAAPDWGTGMRVRDRHGSPTYVFLDGVTRTLAHEVVEPAPPPGPEDRARLRRGSQTDGAMPVAVHLGLEAQISAAPDDAGPYLVYADWLLQQCDPRGELIHLQHQRALDPSSETLAHAEAALLAKHPGYFLPPRLVRLLPGKPGDPGGASWRLGFLDRVSLIVQPDGVDGVTLTAALAVDELLAHSSAGFLRGLAVGVVGDAAVGLDGVVSAIDEARRPRVEELAIEHLTPGLSPLGNASRLLAALPALRRLVLRTSWVEFAGPIASATLRHLTIRAATVPDDLVEQLTRAALPALESIDLHWDTAHFVHRVPRGESFPLGQLPQLRVDQPPVGPALPPGAGRLEPLARAPDATTAAAARAIARVEQWAALGRDGAQLWGEFDGPPRYYVSAWLDRADTSCSCPGTQRPCKHALALVMIAVRGHVFTNGRSRSPW